MSEKTVGQRVFDAQIEWVIASEAASDALLEAMGIDPRDTSAWPAFHDFGFDYYDGSFELYGIEDLTLTLTPAQQQTIAALGFSHGWFNYVDGTARHFYQSPKQGDFSSEPSYHHGPTVADHVFEGRKKGRAARQLIADILADYQDNLTKADCDACEDCGQITLCDFHSLLSALEGRTWTRARMEREGKSAT